MKPEHHGVIVPYSSILPGTVFSVDNEWFIKTEAEKCVDLDNGDLVGFIPSTSVVVAPNGTKFVVK